MSQRRLVVERLEDRTVPALASDSLQLRLEDQLATSTGRNGIAVIDLNADTSTTINGDEVFGTSSTIKLGVLYALLRHIDAQDSVSLDTTLDVGSQYGTNQGDTLAADTSYTLRFLAETMIDNSNNWATNRLIDFLGVNYINNQFSDLGLSVTRIDRYNTGTGSVSMHGNGTVAGDYRAGHDNESTPNEMTSLLRQVHENEGLLSDASYTAYWEIMNLNDSGIVTRVYDSSVYAGPGNTWDAALELDSKPGSNTWIGSAGDFSDDPDIGDHYQRSEAGRITFTGGHVIFYAMFVDEATNADAPFTTMGYAGFEIAREFAKGVVTITPAGAELSDDKVMSFQGTDNNDNIQIQSSDSTITVRFNDIDFHSYSTGNGALNSLQVYGEDGEDTITIAPDFAPSDFGFLAFAGGDGADTFDLTPSTVAEILLNGDEPVDDPGDRLIYRRAGTVTLNSDLNLIESDGMRNVGFQGIETLPVPTISPIDDQVVSPTAYSLPIAFDINDFSTALDELVVTVSTSDESLITALSLGGIGANRTVDFYAGTFTGVADITITVLNQLGLSTTQTFTVFVDDQIDPNYPPYPPPPPGPPVPPPPGTAAPLRTYFAVGAGRGGSSLVTVRDTAGQIIYSVDAFPGFTGGVRVASGDFNRDGVPDLVVATGPGRATLVRVLDGTNRDNVLFEIAPFEASFTGGLYVGVGDVNGDGIPDLLITPDEGGGPRVRLFNGANFQQIADFFGIDDPNFRGGARASFADLNNDGFADLLVAAGFGGGPRLAGFDGNSIGGTPIKLFADFFLFESKLRNGAFITGGDLDGDGFDDVIGGGGPGGAPRVFAVSGKDLVNSQGETRTQLANYFAGDVNNRGGVRVVVADLDGDAQADLITGAGDNGGSTVRAYAGKSIGGSDPTAFITLEPYSEFANGVFVG